MKCIRAIGLTLLLLTSASVLGDEAARIVTVDGKGSVTVPPDMAHVSMAVQARDLDMAAARQRVLTTTRDFLGHCDELGIDAGKIQTTGLSIQPMYRWNESRSEQVLQGYLVRRQVSVELDDLELLGAVMEGAVDQGINEVSPPRLASSREAELHRQALAAAARDAAANAAVLADTLGVSVGNVIEVNASRQQVPPPVPVYARAAMAESDSAPATYSAGEIRFEASVNATFELIEAN